MSIDVKVPNAGESITEVQIGEWLKKKGEFVQKDEILVELDTDKTVVEVPAPEAGVLEEILAQTGDMAEVGQIVARLAPGEGGENGKAQESQASASGGEKSAAKNSSPDASAENSGGSAQADLATGAFVMPAAQALLDEHGLSPDDVKATGPSGRLLKEDVLNHLKEQPKPQAVTAESGSSTAVSADASPGPGDQEIVPMTMIRRKIAERLVEAQQQAALLTTFNECDMLPIMELRKKYKDTFAEKHEVKLGFMSFFVKAVVEALKLIPALNAEVRGTDVVYRNYFDIGVAIGSGRGLVVPVLRRVESMGFSDVEKEILRLAKRANENKLTLKELEGGTFTISNGGVYGSLLSTPIVNPPQSGILGMHSIQERPVAINGEVVIRPMMYLALTYDHRIVDGREAVTFLKRVKDLIEDPARILLEI